MIDKEIAVNLTHGTELFSSLRLDSRGNPSKVRVTGKCKTWKRDPERFKLPVKYGLYESFYIVNDEFAKHWHLNIDEARAAFPSGRVESRRILDQRGALIQVNTVEPIE